MKIDTNKIKVAIVDDNAINRQIILNKLNVYNEIEVIINASTGHDFLESIKSLTESYLPQIVFMDIQMPGLTGIETISIAKALHPSIQFIVLTVFEDEDTVFEAIQAGACGYLLKHEDEKQIRNAIDEILNYGGAPMSPAIARKTLKMLGQTTRVKEEKINSVLDDLLSDREQEILQNLVHGYDAKRIADIINISVLTVRKHISNIYSKLHVNSKAQIISLAHKNNWV